jgi:hypothetical protein
LPDQKPQRLDYMTPEAPSPRARARRTGAGCSSVILLLLGLPTFAHGVLALIHWAEEPNRFWRSDDSSGGMLALGFGALCLFMSMRWGWFALRGSSGS